MVISTTRPRRATPHRQTNHPVSRTSSHRPGQTASPPTLRSPPWVCTTRHSTPQGTPLGGTRTIPSALPPFIRWNPRTAEWSNPSVTNKSSRIQVTDDPPFHNFMRQPHNNLPITLLYHLRPDRVPRILILEQVHNDLGNRCRCHPLNGPPPSVNLVAVPQTRPLPPTHTMMRVHILRLTLWTWFYPGILPKLLIPRRWPSYLRIWEKCLRTPRTFRAMARTMAHSFPYPSHSIIPHKWRKGE